MKFDWQIEMISFRFSWLLEIWIVSLCWNKESQNRRELLFFAIISMENWNLEEKVVIEPKIEIDQSSGTKATPSFNWNCMIIKFENHFGSRTKSSMHFLYRKNGTEVSHTEDVLSNFEFKLS